MRSKILMLFLCTLLLVGSVSAFEFDNVKNYDPATKTIEIRNSVLGIPFLELDQVAKATLITPEINYVMPGKDRQVMIFQIENFAGDYKDALKDLEILNMKKDKLKEVKNYYWEYAVYGDVEVDDYVTECYDDLYQGKLTEFCSPVKSGSHIERQIIRWEKFKDKDLPAGNITVALVTDVKKNDHYDGVPTLFGVKIPEWAEWQESYSTGLVAYWNFDEGSGTNAIDVRSGLYNGTITGGTYETGKLGDGLRFVGDETNYVDFGAHTELGGDTSTETVTICAWVNSTSSADYPTIYGSSDGTTSGFVFTSSIGSNGKEGFISQPNSWQSSTAGVTLNQWEFVCIAVNSGTGTFYLNGNSNGNTAAGQNWGTGANWRLAYYGANQEFTGMIDEVGVWNRSLNSTEITALYNGGSGMTYPTGYNPTVTLNAPADAAKYTVGNVNINCSAGDDVEVINVTLFIGGVANYTQAGSGSNFTELYQEYSNLPEGSYSWTCDAYDDEGNRGTTGSRSFTVDSTSPQVTILSPSNATNFITFSEPYNVTVNVSVSDNVGLGNCWFENATGNTSITCGANVTQAYSPGWNYVTYYANDTVGNINSSAVSFFVNFVNFTFGSDPTVIEGENTTISFNLTATSISSVSANLTYNNTVYVMSGSSNSTAAQFLRSVTAPTISANANISLQVNFTINGAASNTSTAYQLVYNIPDLVVQAAACTDPVLWFELKDEQNFTTLNGTIEYNFEYGTANNNTFSKKYGQLTSATSFYVCANMSIAPNWTLGSGEIYYRTTDHVDRRYYLFEGATLTNATLTNVTLYDLLSSDQTSFKLEVEDTSLNPYIEKFTALLRWYPQLDEYKIVEMGFTDEKGDTVIHVEDEDVDYRVAVYEKNGTLIKMEDPTRFVCLVNPCTYTLKISPGDTDFTSLFDVDYTFTYNTTTSIWSFIYSDSSQKTSGMNLTIYKITGTSVYEICSDYSTDYAGVLSCNTSLYSGNLKGVVTRSASPGVPFVQKLISTGSTAFKSTFGLWLSLLIGIPIVFIFSIMSPIAAVLGGVVALIPALYFGAINWAILGGIAVLAGIVMHFLKRIG